MDKMKMTLTLLAMLGCGVSAQAGWINMPFVGINNNNEDDRFPHRGFIEEVLGEGFVAPVVLDDDYEGGFGFDYSDDDDNQAGPSGANAISRWDSILETIESDMRNDSTGDGILLLYGIFEDLESSNDDEVLVEAIGAFGDFMDYYQLVKNVDVRNFIDRELDCMFFDGFSAMGSLFKTHKEGAVHDALVLFLEKMLLNDSLLKKLTGAGMRPGAMELVEFYFSWLKVLLEAKDPSGMALLKAFDEKNYLESHYRGGDNPTLADIVFPDIAFELVNDYISDEVVALGEDANVSSNNNNEESDEEIVIVEDEEILPFGDEESDESNEIIIDEYSDSEDELIIDESTLGPITDESVIVVNSNDAWHPNRHRSSLTNAQKVESFEELQMLRSKYYEYNERGEFIETPFDNDNLVIVQLSGHSLTRNQKSDLFVELQMLRSLEVNSLSNGNDFEESSEIIIEEDESPEDAFSNNNNNESDEKIVIVEDEEILPSSDEDLDSEVETLSGNSISAVKAVKEVAAKDSYTNSLLHQIFKTFGWYSGLPEVDLELED